MFENRQVSDQAKRSEIAKMILDDDWIPVQEADIVASTMDDEISFKPLTDGLGFLDQNETIAPKLCP